MKGIGLDPNGGTGLTKAEEERRLLEEMTTLLQQWRRGLREWEERNQEHFGGRSS